MNDAAAPFLGGGAAVEGGYFLGFLFAVAFFFTAGLAFATTFFLAVVFLAAGSWLGEASV